ncbi:MAG: hypothetical protein IJU39_01130 [Clostridia bacterium]|nr:hypothetical protein [Clostridia bacterium]
MPKQLTLSQLGYEYLALAQEIDEKIVNYNRLLKEAVRSFDPDEMIRLRRMLRLYYEQRGELRYNGKLLINYYEKE